MHLTYRKSCLACGSQSLIRVVDLGLHHLQGIFLRDEEDNRHPMRVVPMTLLRCDPMSDEHACGLLQTEHGVPAELMYTLYWYRSGTNNSMRQHLKSIVNSVTELKKNQISAVLDIGCNDGTLLNLYPDSVKRVGIDPSNIIPESHNEITYIRDFFPSPELTARLPNQKFDVITSIAMFYDLNRPSLFLQAIKSILAPEGIWVVEVSYMPDMLAQGSYDSICHEHVSYFSFAVLERLFESEGMHVVRAEFNTMNGGSIRCFVTHQECFAFKDNEELEHLREIRIREFDMELDTDRPYSLFQAKAEKNRAELLQLVKSLHSQGKTIHLYGASTKGNSILQWCSLNNRYIDCAADRNPEKWGLRTPASDIPIISEEESRKLSPDYYLVMPWHFKNEFIDREKEALARGTKFIFPLPQIEVVGG